MVEGIKEKIMPSKTIVAIICITLLLGAAIFKEIDGTILASGLMAIAGLGGYVAGKATKK